MFALTEEACLQKTAEPRRPAVLLIFPRIPTIALADASYLLISIWAYKELIKESNKISKNGKKKKKKKVYHVQKPILMDSPLLFGLMEII